jgi:hypothetical protein
LEVQKETLRKSVPGYSMEKEGLSADDAGTNGYPRAKELRGTPA